MRSLEERFWSKVDKCSDEECWHWLAGRFSGGYGSFRVGDHKVIVHRLAYELYNGCPIPEGKMVLHKCDVPLCCNPDHLYIRTQWDNMRDMSQRGRSVSNPDKCALGKAQLSAKDLIAIRELKGMRGMSQSKVGKLFGFNPTTIWKVWNAIRYPSTDGYFVEFGGSHELT